MNQRIRQEIKGAVEGAWHSCGSWIEAVDQILKANDLEWTAEVERMAFERLTRLNATRPVRHPDDLRWRWNIANYQLEEEYSPGR